MIQPIGQLPSSANTVEVTDFCRRFQLTDTPLFVPNVSAGYGPDWCHVSAKHHAIANGGKRVHGWALWEFPSGVMGDFHSVCEDKDGNLIDVTPPKFGAPHVLFVRDRASEIYCINDVFALPTNRMSPPNAPFWWEGEPTSEQIWGLSAGHPVLLAYCQSLDFPVAEMETSSPHG